MVVPELREIVAGVCIIDAQLAGFIPQRFNFMLDILLIIRNKSYTSENESPYSVMDMVDDA